MAQASAHRQTPSMHRQAAAIPLRRARGARTSRPHRDIHESRWTQQARTFRYTCNFLRTFAAERGVDLGRARLLRIPSGHQVEPHIDHGDYYLFRDRYHLILKSSGGSCFTANDERVTMREGELWWFNNKIAHATWNHAASDHIHLVFDVLNADGRRMLDHATRVRTARESLPATLTL